MTSRWPSRSPSVPVAGRPLDRGRPAADVEPRRRWLWLGGYTLLALLPLGAAWVTDPLPTPRPWIREFSVALGFIAFALLLLQFALVSRFGPVARPFGADALMQWHRGAALLGLAFAIAHPWLLADLSWRAWNPFSGPPALQSGALALWATITLVATSVGRRRLRLSYETWQVIHLALACLLAGTLVWHVLAVGGYGSAVGVRWVVGGYLGLFVGLLLRYRLARPLQLLSRPWQIVSNEAIGARTRLVRVRPVNHDGFTFAPGQFAWLVTGRSPLVSEQHPLSIASSAVPDAGGDIEFAIKALGDWSAHVVPAVQPGGRVFVDGPFGGFTPSADQARGLVLIAGGIGIAPMRSMLLTMRERGESRRVWLFYAASDCGTVAFRDELDQLAGPLQLQIIYVLERHDAEGPGERGRLSRTIFDRHLPADRAGCEYYVCGPAPMMDAVERDLSALGVPRSHVHTERFQMV